MQESIGRSVDRPTAAKQIRQDVSIPGWYEQFPGIWDIFSEAFKVSQVPLLPSITVFPAGSLIRVCFCERGKKRSVFRTAETPNAAISAIDQAIMAGNADWRPSGRQKR